MNNPIIDGISLTGVFSAVQAESWVKNDKSGENYRLIISNPYIDSYGNSQTQNFRVDISQDEYHRLNARQEDLKGKSVVMPLMVRSVPYADRQTGKPQAFTSYFMRDNSLVELKANLKAAS